MEPMILTEINKAVGGRLQRGRPETPVTGINIDSRAVRPGDLFFALPGSRVDGHRFVADADSRGAAAAVVAKPVEDANLPQIVVNDVLRALQDLASYNLTRYRLTVVAVTGSTGKTSTKDLIAGVLSCRYLVLKTAGNHNNEIGLPLTLLSLNKSHGAVVLEMAMRGPGEIASLCRIGRPQIGVITNIGLTHLELLGSQAAIAETKGELLEALPATGCAVLNADDSWQTRITKRSRAPVIYYGDAENAVVRAANIRGRGLDGVDFTLIIPGDQAECSLPVPGRHNVQNALAAAAVGYKCGLTAPEIALGLASSTLTGMRLEVKKGLRGSRIIDDTYNASPDSVNAALDLLAQVPGKKRAIAVLGEMYELGSASEAGHRSVGTKAATLGLECLCTVGKMALDIAAGARDAGMPSQRVHVFLDKSEAAAFLQGILSKDDLLLIKGSRGMKMDEMVASLREHGEDYE
jgi:UDP-N-acetylmuramoyl-tripeptide--D-alanyl-D-alanine ligase